VCVRQKSSSPSSKPNMAYLVRISARAERDLALLYQKTNAEQSVAAKKWYLGLTDAISSLEQHPKPVPDDRREP
jgi:plasmid stabilization system protein ParE